MMTRSLFGTAKNGEPIERFTIKNKSGVEISLITVGAAVQDITVPDQDGNPVHVVLGYDHAEDYLHTRTFAGTICGRVANRVGGASFRLGDHEYKLTANDGRNQLHGGPGGFYQKIWDAEVLEDGVCFSLFSPDGEEGYPGNFKTKVTYRLSEDNVLSIDYEAVSDQDTICNLTNHNYWNLKGYGCGDALEQKVQISADFFTPISDETMPTGEIAPVYGPFDLREETVIAEGKKSAEEQIRKVNGYDHNFVLRNYEQGKLIQAARLSDPDSGRAVEIYTTMPGLQFFSGSQQKEGYTGVALETQYFPNAMNCRWFPSIILPAHTKWTSRTEYRLSLGLW